MFLWEEQFVSPRSGTFPFNPVQITRVIPLLAVLAGIVWAITLGWLYLAESSTERTAAGVLAALETVAIIAGAILLAKISPTLISGADVGSSEVTEVANAIATSPAISQHEAEEQAEREDDKPYIGKLRDFVISDPRPQWTPKWMSLRDLLMESGLTDQDVLSYVQQQITAVDPLEDNILSIQSNVTYNLQIAPGQTRLNGLPTLGVFMLAPVRPQIAITSYNKFASMQVDRQPLVAFALERVGGLASARVLPTRVDQRPRDDGREAVIIEAEQSIDGVEVNGIADQNIKVKNSVVCIEGYVRNYAIILQYVEGSVVEASDKEGLQKISNSFRIVDPDDLEEAVKSARSQGHSRRQDYISRNREELLQQNYYTLILMLSNLDLGDEEDLQVATREVGRFLDLLAYVEGDASNYEDLKAAREKALHGDSQDFVEYVQEDIAEMINTG